MGQLFQLQLLSVMKFVADIEVHSIYRPALEVNTQKMYYRLARVGHLSGLYSNLEWYFGAGVVCQQNDSTDLPLPLN
jgi:hypothetical protein